MSKPVQQSCLRVIATRRAQLLTPDGSIICFGTLEAIHSCAAGARPEFWERSKSVLPMAIAGLQHRTHGQSHGLQEMKIDDYRSILRAVEQAIQICDESAKSMDKTHQDICAELRITRARLHQLISQDASTEN